MTANAVGSVQFSLLDELMKKVAGAAVTVQNQAIPELLYNVTSSADGAVAITDIPEGRYSFNITAAGHNPYSGSFVVTAGLWTVVPIALEVNLVKVEWSVTPTTIQDQYRISVTQTFDTNVPTAVIVIEPPAITLPAMKPGQVFNGEFTITNYGLITADYKGINYPANFSGFELEVLATIPPKLNAMQKVTVPYRITKIVTTAAAVPDTLFAERSKLFGEVSGYGGSGGSGNIMITPEYLVTICPNSPNQREARRSPTHVITYQLDVNGADGLDTGGGVSSNNTNQNNQYNPNSPTTRTYDQYLQTQSSGDNGTPGGFPTITPIGCSSGSGGSGSGSGSGGSGGGSGGAGGGSGGGGGGATVIESSGSYDAKTSDGFINVAPRQQIAREYISRNGDTADFIVTFTTFPFVMPEAGAEGFYLGVKNDTQGIGLSYFDDSAFYGSSGKLQGMIDLGDITPISNDPLDPKFEEKLRTLSHEITHRWGAYVGFRKNGTTSMALLGKNGGHWSYLLDSSGSLMYGNAWQDNKDGSFTSTGIRSIYSALDLYLMGLYDKTQVPPMTLIQNQGINPAQMPNSGATITGTASTLSIDDIIAAVGVRVPAAAQALKEFKVGFALVVPPSATPASSDLAKVEAIRNAWAGRFAALTGGLGKIADITPSLSVAIASPLNGSTVAVPDVTVEGSIINTTGNETGVAVNGIPATVNGSRFIANRVPLATGDNTITVAASDTGGQTATATATVTNATANYIRLHANIQSGTVPLTVSLHVLSSFGFSSCNIERIGPAAVGLSQGASLSDYNLTFLAEGVYTIKASVNGPDGQTYTDSLKFIVMSKAGMDRLVKQKWNGIKAKLTAVDVEGAVSYLPTLEQDYHRQLFTAFGNGLPTFGQGLPPIQLIYVSDDRAKGLVFREETVPGGRQVIGYPVYLIQENGIWKFQNF